MQRLNRARYKNSILVIGAIVYWAFGYAFAYGDVDKNHPQSSANRFIGFKFFFSTDIDDGSGFYATWFFQFVFAATAATIVSGAVAERTQFGAYLVYSTFITGFIYPVVTHWGWSKTGWLQNQIVSKILVARTTFIYYRSRLTSSMLTM